MDPNLFHVDWDRVTEVLVVIVLLSLLLERALAPIFEHRLFVNRLQDAGFKEPIAFLMAFLVCWRWDFDGLSMILLTDKTTLLGKIITAGIVAGGSKGSVKLFRDYLGIRSTAYNKTRPLKQ